MEYDEDRFLGALLGMACGDAVGTTVEFMTPERVRKNPVTDMRGGGPFDLQKGQWTDDTSMALCMAESLIESKGYDPLDIMKKFVKWWKEGHLSSTGVCFDIGTTTKKALSKFLKNGGSNAYCGSPMVQYSGNGSLMRLVPIPMFYCHKPLDSIVCSDDSSRLTHASPLCVDSCRYFAGLLVGALQGDTKENLLSPMYLPKNISPQYWQKSPLNGEVHEVAMGSFKTKVPPEIIGSGYVVKTLEAALWAFHTTATFEEGCLKVVNLGHDADTTGAVYGQIAGAYYGRKGLPEKWLKCLSMRDKIENFGERLYELAQQYGSSQLPSLSIKPQPQSSSGGSSSTRKPRSHHQSSSASSHSPSTSASATASSGLRVAESAHKRSASAQEQSSSVHQHQSSDTSAKRSASSSLSNSQNGSSPPSSSSPSSPPSSSSPSISSSGITITMPPSSSSSSSPPGSGIVINSMSLPTDGETNNNNTELGLLSPQQQQQVIAELKRIKKQNQTLKKENEEIRQKLTQLETSWKTLQDELRKLRDFVVHHWKQEHHNSSTSSGLSSMAKKEKDKERDKEKDQDNHESNNSQSVNNVET